MRAIFITFLLVISVACSAQNEEVIRAYIDTYKDIAIAEMQRTGVPASIKLAQGIHETMAGTSPLVLKSNNHFGIKCKSDWKGESVSHTDDAPNECFRKYVSPADSYRDHSNFLKNSQRYSSLFKLDPLDYEDWAYGLKNAGYATNPRYPQIIIKLVEDYHLQDYSMIAMGKMEAGSEYLANANSGKTNEQAAASKTGGMFLEDISVKIPANGKKEIVKTDNIDAKEIKKDYTPAYTIQKVKEVQGAAIVKEEPKPDYPSGDFKINETRVVYAKKGTSFLSIAEQYNIPLARLFEFNDDRKAAEQLEADQLVYLQRKRRTGNNEYHVVKPGETLADIAQSEALRLEALMEYNYLDKNSKPATGEQLYLRAKAPAAPRLVKN